MILVDTDVLIAHLRGHARARDWLRSAREQGRLSASAVTLTELTGGMRSPERREVTRLLSALHLRPVTLAIARQAGVFMRSYRASHTGIGLGDYLVAATAEVLGLELATLNVRHFPMFEELEPPFAWQRRRRTSLILTRLGIDTELAFLDDLAAGTYIVECLTPRELRKAAVPARRHRELELGLADASIVVLAERLGTRQLLTFDERAFRAVRPLQGGAFEVLPADGRGTQQRTVHQHAQVAVVDIGDDAVAAMCDRPGVPTQAYAEAAIAARNRLEVQQRRRVVEEWSAAEPDAGGLIVHVDSSQPFG